jgi:hypothetical protein
MSTVTRPRQARPFTCSLVSMTIEINDDRYSVDRTSADAEFGDRSYRLTKHSARDGGCYDVIRLPSGIVACDCPDYVARHEGNGHGLCKHGRALVALGMLPAPIAPEYATPAPSPAPAPVLELELEPFSSTECDILSTFDDELGPVAPVARCVCIECDIDPAHCSSDCDPGPAGGPLERGREDDGPARDFRLPGDDGADPDDSGCDPELWGPEADRHQWNLSPESAAVELLDHSDRLTLAELTDRQAAFYRGWGNATGEMFARALEELAVKIRMTDSTTPEELEGRVEVLDRDIREQWESRGYEDAKAIFRAETPCPASGHMA